MLVMAEAVAKKDISFESCWFLDLLISPYIIFQTLIVIPVKFPYIHLERSLYCSIVIF